MGEPDGVQSQVAGQRWVADFAADVRAGLTKPEQKELPSKYLYDEIGSVLFEAITLLPEYGLTRAGQRLLRRHADHVLDALPHRGQPLVVAELGSGSGKKTRWLLDALARRPGRKRVTYCPIDISRAALDRCQRELEGVPSLSVVPFQETYLNGLREVAARRDDRERLLLLFLGSTIGNFDRSEGERFLVEVRRGLEPGDALLLATDLEKPVETLLAAYDDSLGVTAAFNLNLLARVNRELGANFDLDRFRHEARWNPAERRVEMHLRAISEQLVALPGAELNVAFLEGETIWTESSHKYNLAELPAMARRTGFACRAQWVDSEWPFAQSLFVAA